MLVQSRIYSKGAIILAPILAGALGLDGTRDLVKRVAGLHLAPLAIIVIASQFTQKRRIGPLLEQYGTIDNTELADKLENPPPETKVQKIPRYTVYLTKASIAAYLFYKIINKFWYDERESQWVNHIVGCLGFYKGSHTEFRNVKDNLLLFNLNQISKRDCLRLFNLLGAFSLDPDLIPPPRSSIEAWRLALQLRKNAAEFSTRKDAILKDESKINRTKNLSRIGYLAIIGFNLYWVYSEMQEVLNEQNALSEAMKGIKACPQAARLWTRLGSPNLLLSKMLVAPPTLKGALSLLNAADPDQQVLNEHMCQIGRQDFAQQLIATHILTARKLKDFASQCVDGLKWPREWIESSTQIVQQISSEPLEAYGPYATALKKQWEQRCLNYERLNGLIQQICPDMEEFLP